MSSRHCFAILVVSITCGSHAFAQGVLRGRVMDADGNPVSFASIAITNSGVGAASDQAGRFLLRIAPTFTKEKLAISCVGYRNRYLPIDSLMARTSNEIVIVLEPYVQYLGEVIVDGRRPGPEDLLKEAIAAVPLNYSQEPFNLQFYSKITVKDSVAVLYVLETVLQTYRAGYVRGASNWSRILQKREYGKSPLAPDLDKKAGRKYFPFVPGFAIFLIDQIGVGDGGRYSVFNPKKFSKMAFAYTGLSLFDDRPVSVIEYSLRQKDVRKASEDIDGRYNGVIYIALDDLAIIRHTLKIGATSSDIIYKKREGYYFPYLIRSERQSYGPDRSYVITNTVSLRDIHLEKVQAIDQHDRILHHEDVVYDKQYWDENYPQ